MWVSYLRAGNAGAGGVGEALPDEAPIEGEGHCAPPLYPVAEGEGAYGAVNGEGGYAVA